MTTYVITVNPSAPGSANLAEALSKLDERMDMISKSEIHVTASERDVLKIAFEYPDAVMKVETL